jgi:tetratricopeptide (TPR) repeat protein
MTLSASVSATSAPRRERYEQRAGLHVLRLSGDDYEMGYQHGQLLREAMARGPVPYFEEYIEKLIGTSLGPSAGRIAAKLLAATVGRRVARGFPPHARRALHGLADGAGLGRRALMGAVTMPESYLWVLKLIMQLERPAPAPRHAVPLMGCTSAMAWGEATRDGALLHGRNFDYQGVGAWDREQAVVFHRPSDGQPYVSVAAAGILFGGITAMNEAGLSLVVHQHMASTDLRLGGTPIGVTGDQVMRYAKNLDDAQRILDEDTPNGCWTYVIGSAREQAALCYEITPRGRAAFRIDDGSFGYSNIYLDPRLAESELNLYPSHWRNNTARFHRVRGRLADARGRIDENEIASILGDRSDPRCRLRHAIAMPMTVASVVFRPGDALVYVAPGRAPTSNREFVAFDLAREDLREDLPALRGGIPDDADARDAFDAYRDAYEAYFNSSDTASARRHIARACTLAPGEALYHFMNGLLALVDRAPSAAEHAFDRALELGHPDAERLAAFHLWRARSRDVQGRRAQALSDYRMVERADHAVERAAQRGLRRAWRPRRFGIEFALADVPTP